MKKLFLLPLVLALSIPVFTFTHWWNYLFGPAPVEENRGGGGCELPPGC